MFSKLLKKDLKKDLSWMWILFVSAILVSLLARGCSELGANISFFKVLSIFLDTVFYALIANCIIHPFLRSFLNFTKSIYGDESYLTHTLPVTKNQIINSKFLTALIEILLGFVCVISALLIRFASADFFTIIELLLSTLISGKFSTFLVIALIVLLIIVEFLMFISIIFFSIVKAYKSKEKKVLKSFLITGLMSFIALTILAVVMLVVMLINGVDLTSNIIVLSSSALYSLIISGIVVYSAVIIVFYYLTKREFNKGVNVD